MTQAVAVRRDGDAFQARYFWRRAVSLLDPSSPVIRVGFESGPKGFDDVWVQYEADQAPKDQTGHPIYREHVQCKWHVSVNDFGYADLADPAWINANAYSLLQRARAAQTAHAKDGVGARFKLLTNWRIGQQDPLRQLIQQKSKTLRLETLFDNSGDKSRAGQIRKLWREHLGIDDIELRTFVRTLALDTDSTSLEEHREYLDQLLELRGLRRIPIAESSFIYDDVTYQWLSQGRLEFDRASFIKACKDQQLFDRDSRVHVVFGVKSFEHAFDRLEDRCSSVLNLISQFDERAIRNQADWKASLYPELKTFLHGAARTSDQLRLVLDAHITLAFAAGSVLNIKSGRKVEVEQRTLGRNVWHSGDQPADPAWPAWNFGLEVLSEEPGDMAVAVSLTHDVAPAVRAFLARSLPGVSSLLVATPSCGPGAKSVVCGQHAFDLAESLVRHINSLRTESRPTLHLFVAAPNAFTFFLGQRQPSLGMTTLYEYDLEGGRGGSYSPSLTLPV